MSFTHLDAAGHARMVDVTEKQPTVRAATARGFVRCAAPVVAALRDGSVPKGDVLAKVRDEILRQADAKTKRGTGALADITV